MMTTADTPRVWVGCLGCYNAGRLLGEWFDATDAPEDMKAFRHAYIDKHLTGGIVPEPWRTHFAEAHEELWVFDHENFHGLLTGECSPATAKELAEKLDESDNPEAFAAYVTNHVGLTYARNDWEAAVQDFGEAYCGEYDSGEDYAQELAEDIGTFTVPAEPYSRKRRDLSSEWPFTCIDWERAWRELDMGGDNFAVETGRGTVFVFRAV